MSEKRLKESPWPFEQNLPNNLGKLTIYAYRVQFQLETKVGKIYHNNHYLWIDVYMDELSISYELVHPRHRGASALSIGCFFD